MSPKDVTQRAAVTQTLGAAVPVTRRLGWLGLLGFVGLVSTFTCSNSTIPPGQNGTTNGLCNYPRSCYLVNSSGPNAGACDDCSSTSTCRLVFTPDNPADWQSVAGSWKTAGWKTSPTDAPAVCGLYPGASATKTAICATIETVCVARGPACNGYCVQPSALAPDGGTDDMGNPAACSLGTPVAPQRRAGGMAQTYCPRTDDVCCASPAGPDGGAVGDGGVIGDGGVDAAPADQSSVG